LWLKEEPQGVTTHDIPRKIGVDIDEKEPWVLIPLWLL